MRRVVKVGGSLLLRPQLERDLQAWLSAQSPAETLIVVGGGELIDAIRKLDRLGRSDPATIHWRCVELLQTTFQFMSDWCPGWPTIETASQLHDGLRQGFAADLPVLVAVRSFYSPERDQDLPLDWRTTTDAIAAALAIESSSDELVLLKSCHVDRSKSIDELAAAAVVDDALPLLAGRLSTIRIERLEESPIKSSES